MKILSEEEINSKNYLTYSESYRVRFWIKSGEFWEQDSKIYYSTQKGANVKVWKKAETDFRNKIVKIISVSYIG